MRRSLFFLLALGLLVPARALASCAEDGSGHSCCESASSEVAMSYSCGMPSCEASPAGPLAQGLPSATAQVHFDAASTLVSDAISLEAALAPRAPRPAGALPARAAPDLALLSTFRN